jgi:CubicO group peptidase (beta-lactamase class C family)
MNQEDSSLISGIVKPGFEPVRKVFIENFTYRNELGAACCIYYQGEKVVDLWGGIRNKATGEPWEEDTMVVVHSTTKGLSAMALALLHSRGLLDYEERVSTYWPEFAQQGKEKITVRQLLGHQAGLAALDAPVDRAVVADLDRLAVALAQQKPAWEPGTRQGYHAISLGFYEGELLRRVDPQHRSLGQFFQDEIASPLDLDFYIRLPEEITNSRLATYYIAKLPEMIIKGKRRFLLAFFSPGTLTHRAFWKNPGPSLPFDAQHIYSRNLEVPSQGGVGTARAIARAYSVFATGGKVLQLSQETLQALMASAVPPRYGFYDVCLKGSGSSRSDLQNRVSDIPMLTRARLVRLGREAPLGLLTHKPGSGMHTSSTREALNKAEIQETWHCGRRFTARSSSLIPTKTLQEDSRF